MKNIAVIGAGISGLAAAYLLSRRHRVHLFEKERASRRPHQHGRDRQPDTAACRSTPASWCTTTAPIRTWCGCSAELGVATRDSDMSFAVSCRRTGLEYSSRGANGFFAQRRNLVSPSHLFAAPGDRALQSGSAGAARVRRTPSARRSATFSSRAASVSAFTHRYLFPMASAIWSASLDAIRSFPALTLIRFFDNHGLLSLHEQPTWKVVAGGSHTYIPKLTAPLSGRHPRARGDSQRAAKRARRDDRLPRSPVDGVRRGGVRVPRRSGAAAARRPQRSRARGPSQLHHHDQRGVAAHRRVGAAACRQRARASWNYLLAADADAAPTVTYDLNRLQGLTTPEQYCVTLNPDGADRRAPRAAPVRLSPPAVHARGHRARRPRWARGQRRQPHALLRRLLVLWVSRGRVELGAQGRQRARGRVVIDSGLFVGTLRHRRFAPVAHAFTYPLFMALLDVDRVPELMRVSRLTSYNRWNWASFDDRDHLGDPTRSLRDTARGRRDAPRDRPAGRSHLPADAPAVSRLRLQPGLVLLLLRCRRSGCRSSSPR